MGIKYTWDKYHPNVICRSTAADVALVWTSTIELDLIILGDFGCDKLSILHLIVNIIWY